MWMSLVYMRVFGCTARKIAIAVKPRCQPRQPPVHRLGRGERARQRPCREQCGRLGEQRSCTRPARVRVHQGTITRLLQRYRYQRRRTRGPHHHVFSGYTVVVLWCSFWTRKAGPKKPLHLLFLLLLESVL